jgi:hypothetical protein
MTDMNTSGYGDKKDEVNYRSYGKDDVKYDGDVYHCVEDDEHNDYEELALDEENDQGKEGAYSRFYDTEQASRKRCRGKDALRFEHFQAMCKNTLADLYVEGHLFMVLLWNMVSNLPVFY